MIPANFPLVPPSQRMQIFSVVDDGNVWSKWKLSKDPNLTANANDDWSHWHSLGNGGMPLHPPVVVGYLPDQRMQIFAIDEQGNLWSNWKLTTDPSSGWNGWSNMGNGFSTGLFGVGYLPDLRMQIFAVGSDGTVRSNWKLTTDPSSGWNGWVSLGQASVTDPNAGETTILSLNSPSVGYLPDQRMQIFATSTQPVELSAEGHWVRGGYQVWSKWKLTTAPDSGWSENWVNVGNPEGIYQMGVVVGYLKDQRMQIFALGTGADVNGGIVLTDWKLTTDPNSGWNGWSNQLDYEGWPGYPPEIPVIFPLATGYLPDQTMQLFVLANDGNVYCKLTTDPSSNLDDWINLGNPEESMGGYISVGYLPDQRMQIFEIGIDSNIYSKVQAITAPATPVQKSSSSPPFPVPVPTSHGWTDWENLGNYGASPGFFGPGSPASVSIGYLPG